MVVAQSVPGPAREEAYRANNRGVAYLEQYNHAEAAAEFRKALVIDPSLGLAQTNLAIALFYVPDPPAALEAARAAQTQSPDAPQPAYIQGLIAKSENRVEDAVAAFTRVLAIDDYGSRRPREPRAASHAAARVRGRDWSPAARRGVGALPRDRAL